MNISDAALYWDKLADTIAKAREQILRGAERARWERALRALLPGETPLRILDAGSGSGFLAVILSEWNHQVIGIDISPVMVQCAYETASTFARRIEYRIMDCIKTDFADESFDAIICCEVMPCLSDRKAAWTEFSRILKKEGHVIVFDEQRLAGEQAQAQAHGFSHCQLKDFEGLSCAQSEGTLRCMSARKPLRSRLQPPPQISLFKQSIHTAKKQIQLYQSWCQKSGISYSDYTVLNMLSYHTKGSRPSDISAALVIAPQTLTRILAALYKDGYIDKQTQKSDRRSFVITITEAGLEKIRPIQNNLRELEEKALSDFSIDEMAKVNELSDQILSRMRLAFQGNSD